MYHRPSMRRGRKPKRADQACPSHRVEAGGAPSTASTPPPSAVVRELRERRNPTMHGVRVEYLWYTVRHRAMEAAQTRMPTAAGGGVWGGVREGD